MFTYLTKEYDAAGNLTRKTDELGGCVVESYYAYDGYNRLKWLLSGDTEAVYTYNPEGLRETKTVNGQPTRFLYDGDSVVGELTADNEYIYHRAEAWLAVTASSGERLYCGLNTQGSVTTLMDDAGTQAAAYSYDPYGREQTFSLAPTGEQTAVLRWMTETDATHNPFRYCGEYYDAESGFIYLRNRYYDPSTGRFITEDPARDGVNWYVYCEGNPINRIDPWGLAGDVLSEPEQYEFEFGEYLALRYNAEKWGAEVNYSPETKKATIRFPNRPTATFKVGEEGTYIDRNGVMQVKSSIFKKKTRITQVYSKQVNNKTLSLVSFQKGQNVNLVWNGNTIGKIQVVGKIRNISTVPTDKTDEVMYGRFGDFGNSIDLAAGDIVSQIGPEAEMLYNAATSYHNLWSGVDFDVSSADTKLRINDESVLYYYISVFLAAKGNTITYVGSTFGGV